MADYWVVAGGGAFCGSHKLLLTISDCDSLILPRHKDSSGRDIGMAYEFVRSTERHKDWGIGKILEVGGPVAQVEYFNSPLEEPFIVPLPVRVLRQTVLAPQTRVYWHDKQAAVWRVGRVSDGEGTRISVRFPNGDDRFLPAKDVFAR